MNDIAQALVSAVADACGRHPASSGADRGKINEPLWTALTQIGITLLPVPEEQGGAGGDLLTTVEVLEVLGRHGAAVPFAETALQAAWLLGESSATIPDGPLTAAVGTSGVTLVGSGDGWTIDGELARVPWASRAGHLVLLAGRRVVLLARNDYQVVQGANLAGEPRDRVVLSDVQLSADRVHQLPEASPVDEALFQARGALGRLALIAGAARGALEMSYVYATERRQFGRPIFAFQSVQHQVAAMAGEVLLCKVAVEAAAQVFDDGLPWQLPLAAAKSSAGESAGTVARLAHQVHGAIGFTEEHSLRQVTTAIWSWREECGTERSSAARVGQLAVAAGPRGLWPLLVGERT